MYSGDGLFEELAELMAEETSEIYKKYITHGKDGKSILFLMTAQNTQGSTVVLSEASVKNERTWYQNQ